MDRGRKKVRNREPARRRIKSRGSVRQASAKRTLRKDPSLLKFWKVRHAFSDGRADIGFLDTRPTSVISQKTQSARERATNSGG
jgi:hypothetical protein